MRKRIAFAAATGLLILLVLLRWPRLDPDLAYVTRSESSDDKMLVEYRMSRPFHVALTHGLELPPPPLEAPGMRIGGGATLRYEAAGDFASTYDLLRGEYYVRLKFRRLPSVSVEGNGTRTTIASWSAPDARKVEWEPPGVKLRIGNGVGIYLAHLKTTARLDEFVEAKAGTVGR